MAYNVEMLNINELEYACFERTVTLACLWNVARCSLSCDRGKAGTVGILINLIEITDHDLLIFSNVTDFNFKNFMS